MYNGTSNAGLRYLSYVAESLLLVNLRRDWLGSGGAYRLSITMPTGVHRIHMQLLTHV
jgi:hypothetical protein